MMKNKHVYLIALWLILTSQYVAGQTVCPVIPRPAHYEKIDGVFVLNDHTSIIVKDASFQESARFLQNQLLRYTGICIDRRPGSGLPVIVLERSGNNTRSVEGAYSLRMDAGHITISASDNEGIFYGVISLLQLVMQSKLTGASAAVNCWNIRDAPLYQWRGLMLDESRHFFGKKVVKMILDEMAFYKLNRFHWHLTDAPGWRLQIKKYPKLALIGGIGNYSDPLAPARYYTQDDIREIVAYAKERHIKVIPEIDMPGHATAANRAYPEYSGGGTGRFANFTFNPGREGTYQYLTDILREVSVLFPSGMIHLGGDEVSFGSKSWAEDSGVQRLMTNEHLADLKGVEHYFFRRMDDSALQLFHQVLAWDEAADADLPGNSTVIFWWRQEKPQQLNKALKKGYRVVLCPRVPLYFDFVQYGAHRQGRRWSGIFNSLDRVYAFSIDSIPGVVKKDKLVLGIQANLWTETVKTTRRLGFMLFPRVAALSEAAWTRPGERNYKRFLSRLKGQLPLYQKEGIYYFNPFAPEKTPEAVDWY